MKLRQFSASTILSLATALILVESSVGQLAVKPGVGASFLLMGPGDGAFDCGFAFTPSIDISVFSLGVFDSGADGLASSQTVGIFSNAGSLLRSEVVPAGTAATLTDGFRFVSTTPLHLNAGVSYVIASTTVSELVLFMMSGTEVHPDITLGSSLFDVGAPGLTFPTTVGGYQAYLGPSFQFVPEPSGYALVSGLALVLFGFCRRSMK